MRKKNSGLLDAMKKQRNYSILIIFLACFGWYLFSPQETSAPSGVSPESTPSLNDGGDSVYSSSSVVRQLVKSGTAVPADKYEAQKFLDEVQNNIARLNRCYTEDCSADVVHPRDAYFNNGQLIRAELFKLHGYVVGNNLSDHRISEIAREALENEDGHVQEVALNLMATQETSEANLDSILEKVVKGYDDKLIDQALTELQRYQSAGDQEKIRNALAREILHGAPFVAQAIAQKIEKILNQKNVQYFESLIEKTGAETLVREYLQTSIRSFKGRNG
jgi:hypothetical protein